MDCVGADPRNAVNYWFVTKWFHARCGEVALRNTHSFSLLRAFVSCVLMPHRCNFRWVFFLFLFYVARRGGNVTLKGTLICCKKVLSYQKYKLRWPKNFIPHAPFNRAGLPDLGAPRKAFAKLEILKKKKTSSM